MISAYTIAIGVEQRRFPWRSAIQSALNIADELCLVYDRRFDDPGILQIDDRVRLIETTIDFLEWDFINNLLTKARRNCLGDWCLQTEMDMVFDEKASYTMPLAVQRADARNNDGIHVLCVSPVQNLVEPKAGSRQMLTRNVPYIYHKTSEYMIGYIDSEIWDGKCIGNYAYDDWSLYDQRTQEWFNDREAEFVETGFVQYVAQDKVAIEEKVCSYTHAWHYPFFNPGRKYAQARQTAEWQDRTFGRSAGLNIEELVGKLQQTVIIDPEESRRVYGYFKQSGWVEVDLKHPACVQSWVDDMGLDAV